MTLVGRQVKLVDPDTIVNWYRTDDPGQDPRWESKCGMIEQRSWGNHAPKYYGFFGLERTAIAGDYTTTLASAKKAVECEWGRQSIEVRKVHTFDS